MENKRAESALRQAVQQRNYARARARAFTRLAHLYPTQYKELLEEEKRRDEVEGKKWTSIADSPYFGVDYTPPNGGSSTSSEAGERVGAGAAQTSRNDGAEA